MVTNDTEIQICLFTRNSKLKNELEKSLDIRCSINVYDDVNADIDADLVFLDADSMGISTLSRLKENNFVIVITSKKGSRYLIESMTFGAFDCIIKPFDVEQLNMTVSNAIGIKNELNSSLMEFPGDVEGSSVTCAIVGDSQVLQEICKTIGQVGRVDVPVLITGESGTGKDLVAESIWKVSKRWENPFVVINCAAIPDTLLEAELFGHEKGAFTGAETSRKGKFEEANKGTIFLDEIGDMSLSLQAKLLRVLQNQTFTKLGNNKEIEVNVRLIAATNKDLIKMVEEGKFREDLFYRLNVVEIYLPSLKERKEDIPLLMECFARRHSSQAGKEIRGCTRKFLNSLMNYDWPGNIRELENSVRKAIALTKTKYLSSFDLNSRVEPIIRNNGNDRESSLRTFDIDNFLDRKLSADQYDQNLYNDTIKEVEKSLIAEALNKSKWNRSKASRMLGINRITLRRKIEEYNIIFPGK